MHDDGSPSRDSIRTLPRRRLLRNSALLTGGAVAGLASSGHADAAPQRVASWVRLLAPSTQADLENYTPVALTSTELTTLNAAIDRLIPSDDLGPGAVEAGAFVYIDRTLASDNAAVLPLFQGGLAALAAAEAGGFAGLASDNQDDLLLQADAGDLADAPEGFFGLLLEYTRRGMFGDPIHGGNKDFAGWDLIGYPGIKLVWTAEEQAIDAVVTPEHISVEQYGGKAS